MKRFIREWGTELIVMFTVGIIGVYLLSCFFYFANDIMSILESALNVIEDWFNSLGDFMKIFTFIGIIALFCFIAIIAWLYSDFKNGTE